MRVLQVHNRYRQAGGEDSVARTERHLLEEAGHEIRLHEVENPSAPAEAVGALARAAWNGSAARQVVEAAVDHRADVVHVHNTWFSLSPAVFPALSDAGFPVVATVHNYRPLCVNALLYRDGRICEDCVGRHPWRGILHRCYRGSAAQSAAVAVTITTHRLRNTWGTDVDTIIALTRFAAGELARGGLPADRMVVKPNSAPDPGRRSQPPSDSDVVLFVGRLTEEKGVLDLVEAWKRRSGGGLRLHIVGTGPLESDVRARAGDGVEVLGRRSSEEVRQAMLSARALVFPSRWFEGLPVVLVESLAAGLPVVVFDRGAMAEIAGAGGVVCDGHDIDALAAGLDRLADDELVDRVGGGARGTYQERHRPAQDLEMLEGIYRRAQTGPSGR